MIGGYGITGPGDHYIAPERRCGACGLLLGARETSPCGKCEERSVGALAKAARALLVDHCGCYGCSWARRYLAGSPLGAAVLAC